MSFFGKWTVKKVLVFGSEGTNLMTVDEIRGTPTEEMYSEILDAVIVITPESMNTYAKIPEDQIEEAKAEGAVVTEYGVEVDSHAVKEENGEYFYDSGDEGEIDGEAISPFVKLELNEDGLLPYGGGMFLLQKED